LEDDFFFLVERAFPPLSIQLEGETPGPKPLAFGASILSEQLTPPLCVTLIQRLGTNSLPRRGESPSISGSAGIRTFMDFDVLRSLREDFEINLFL